VASCKVYVSFSFSGLPLRRPKPSLTRIWDRDGVGGTYCSFYCIYHCKQSIGLDSRCFCSPLSQSKFEQLLMLPARPLILSARER
jgi:hypothetical protein